VDNYDTHGEKASYRALIVEGALQISATLVRERDREREREEATMNAMTSQSAYEKVQTLSELNRHLKSSRNSWTHVSRCAACFSLDIHPLANIRYVQYDRCSDCGFTFANPRPPESVLSEFYNSPFYNNYRICERERLKLDPNISISTTQIPMLASWIKDHKSKSVLDFGCGPGSFLAYLRDKHGFTDVEGIELNKESASIAKAIHGITIATDISELRKKSYDVVTLIEVIEHVPDVNEMMGLVGRYLNEGGKLLISTDAINNIPSRYFPSWASHFTGPSHISLFSELALTKLLTRFGYRIDERESEPCFELLGDAVLAPIYKLDFSSPSSIADSDDRLYVPNWLGRLVGLQSTRRPPKFFRRLKKWDGKAARKINPHRFSSHQWISCTKIA
jgi:2-polyprenyl-3-methyl-5-hydroxy-6-metoxy-1,4-benzoquinol methylase